MKLSVASDALQFPEVRAQPLVEQSFCVHAIAFFKVGVPRFATFDEARLTGRIHYVHLTNNHLNVLVVVFTPWSR